HSSKKSTTPKLRRDFKNEKFKKIHETFMEIANSSLGVKGIDTVAGYENYLLKKDFLWRFIWIIGLYGTITEDGLQIDSARLYDNRKPMSLPSNEDQWEAYFNILTQFGVFSELEIKTDDLYTPGGYMRARAPKTNKPTYIIKMKVNPKLQNYQFFKVLNEILSELQVKTGKRAFTYFKKLDFNPILG
ncbi:MAG: hypothetical protein ACFE8N_09915, partial [Promethearchaeota archaeon]